MDTNNKNDLRTRTAVRRVLMASAALAPAWMFAPEAAAQAAPIVNAGPDRVIPDTDQAPGETVTLQGAGVVGNSSDGQIILVWTNAQGAQIGTGATPTVRLPNGVNQLTLTGRDSTNSSAVSMDTVIITVQGTGTGGTLESAGSTPNEKSLGTALDSLCGKLINVDGPTLPATVRSGRTAIASAGRVQPSIVNQASVDDLAARCDGLVNGQESTLKQAQALAQWNPEEFNSLRLLAIDFSQNQFQGIMDRLQALRGGQPRVSLSGVMINSEGKAVSLDQVAQSLHALGGGAGSDDAGGLLDNRLGFWVRGNYGTGRKDTTLADSGFKSDQLGMTGGVDYRIGSASVIGASLGFGKADLDFRSETDSGVKNDTYAVSVYGSAYLGGAYLDAVINYISAQYETNRHIVYTEFGNTIDRTARGATDGTTVSGGINLGYDFNFGAFTVAPTIGYYYADAKIDNFTEVGAMGLDLQFNEQKYKSSAANAAVRLSYAMKTSWGVLIPHFRGTYVHEMDKDAEVFGVRFANDPFASSTDPTPPIVIRSDALDQSYFRLAAGFSAQLKNDLSGYFEYQRLAGFQNVSFEDFTFGLRLQHSFR